MAHIITDLVQFDSKRYKVTLDYGEVTFLLYKGECRRLGVSSEMSDGELEAVMEEILLPRAKKRVLYYLKNGDRTREEIRRRLRSGYYPEEIIEKTMAILDKYGFADDERYASAYIDSLKGTRSAREIEQKLAQKGIRGSTAAEALGELTREDEYTACEKALRKKYSSAAGREERGRAYAYLARRGFSYESIEHAMNALEAEGA